MIIEAKRYLTQVQNRLDATRRLITWIQKALEKPKERKATHPSFIAKAAARVGDKKSMEKSSGLVAWLRRIVSDILFRLLGLGSRR